MLPLPDRGGSRLPSWVSKTKPVYLASDAHLGAAPPEHQRSFLEWLEHAGTVASEVIINGDLFDFWFEYRWGITRGHEDVLALLRSMTLSGLPVTLVGGNHDWWGGAYLRDEIGVTFLQDPVVRTIAGKTAFLAHGDGLGPGDRGYKVVKTVLRSPLTRTAFSVLPIDVGDRIAGGVSNTEHRWDQWGSAQQARSDALEGWALEKLASESQLELVLLGHTHLPMIREARHGKWYVNSGDWVYHQSYVVLDEGRPPELLDWRER